MSFRCNRCGKPLSNPKSIERGYGPVCYKIVSHELKKHEELREKGSREENNYPTFADYLHQLLNVEHKSHEKCFCGTRFEDMDFDHYLSEYSGWWLNGWKYRQWLYLECPKCTHQWAFHHLRVSRSFGNEPVPIEVQLHAKKTMEELQKKNRKLDAQNGRKAPSKDNKQLSLETYMGV